MNTFDTFNSPGERGRGDRERHRGGRGEGRGRGGFDPQGGRPGRPGFGEGGFPGAPGFGGPEGDFGQQDPRFGGPEGRGFPGPRGRGFGGPQGPEQGRGFGGPQGGFGPQGPGFGHPGQGDEEFAQGRPQGRGRRGGRRGGFGGPFGPGFGAEFAGGPGDEEGRGRRNWRARRGEVRTAILQLLAEEPRNGYQVISVLDERTEGAWRPSPGAVYPALNQLEDEGLIEATEVEGAKAFRLTEAGKAAPEVAEETPRPWVAIAEANAPRHAGNATHTLWEEFGALAMALKVVARSGTQDQQSQVAALLADTKRKVFGLLAAAEAQPSGAQPSNAESTDEG